MASSWLTGAARPEGRSRFFARLVVASVVAALPVGPAFAAGALAVGKCGAFGYAFDYAHQHMADSAAKAKCGAACTIVTMRRACAALAVDMKNPCGAFGYAVAPKISGAQNAAMQSCYKYGGKECVIRTWACDAKG